MESSMFPELAPVAKRVAPVVAALVIAGAGVGYAVHEHHSAQTLAVQNQQMTAQMKATDSQVGLLAAKVNSLETAQAEREKPSPSVPARRVYVRHRAERPRPAAPDPRVAKLQSQVDAQGRAIDQTRTDLASTQTDLTNARTQLSGSIARTHSELVALEKKGHRNYYEFDIWKSKQYGRTGPVSIRLRKANVKHQFADLQLIVDDRNLMQKHVNLYQPVLFYQPDSPKPIEVVINQISKNQIRGYVSSPKYRQSELEAMASAGANSASSTAQAANSGSGPALRQRLPVPTADPGQP